MAFKMGVAIAQALFLAASAMSSGMPQAGGDKDTKSHQKDTRRKHTEKPGDSGRIMAEKSRGCGVNAGRKPASTGSGASGGSGKAASKGKKKPDSKLTTEKKG